MAAPEAPVTGVMPPVTTVMAPPIALRDALLERIATALEQSVEIQRRTLDLLERAGALMKEGDR